MPELSDIFSLRNPNAQPNLKAHYFFVKTAVKLGMKNPYEVEKEEFTPELLKTKANDLRAIKSRYDQYVQQLRLVVGVLENVWQNDIQSSFITELGNMQGPVKDFSEMIEQFASFLDSAAQEILKNPAVLQLPAEEQDDEPVHVVLSGVPEPKLSRDELEEYGPFAIPCAKKAEPDRKFLFALFRVLSVLGIKNPYEKKDARIDPQSLKNGALDMRAIITQYDYHIQKLQHILEDLQRLWQNDIQTFFFEEMENMHNGVKDFSSLADEYASLLEIAAHELETNSVEADKASVLSDGTEGPITVVLSNIPYLKRSRMDLKAYDPYFEQTQLGVSTEVSISRKNSEYIYNVYYDHIELVKYIGLKKIVEIPAEIDGLPVTHIGQDCFALAWRVKFTSITMPDTVTTVLPGAFRGCHTIREFKLSKNLTYIGNYAFGFLADLEYIALPEHVVSFGMGAFRNCISLRSVSIPTNTLKRIGNDCFYGCKKLECIVIGNDVVDIDDWAFRMCEHLNSVTMGESVAKIGESAFYDCIRLNRLDIPETVSNIGNTAFYSRRGMTLGVTEGSAAEKYALDNRIPFVHI